MKLLSLECSTAEASLALMENTQVRHAVSWCADAARHEHLLVHVAEAMDTVRWRWDEIDLFVAGRGPGAYSGLRASLLAVQALAAPGRAPVMAVSSMESVAVHLMKAENQTEMMVVGDARRNSFWYGHCRIDALNEPATWKVIPRDRLGEVLVPGVLVASPHPLVHEMIAETIPEVNLYRAIVTPSAMFNAQLALGRREQDASPEPLLPHYMHPAV